MGTGTWPAALKAALNLLGQPAGVPREPVLALAGAELARVERTLQQCGVLGTAAMPVVADLATT